MGSEGMRNQRKASGGREEGPLGERRDGVTRRGSVSFPARRCGARRGRAVQAPLPNTTHSYTYKIATIRERQHDPTHRDWVRGPFQLGVLLGRTTLVESNTAWRGLRLATPSQRYGS